MLQLVRSVIEGTGNLWNYFELTDPFRIRRRDLLNDETRR